MKDSVAALHGPVIPAEVQEFARAKGIGPYLNGAIDLARQAFPTSILVGEVWPGLPVALCRLLGAGLAMNGRDFLPLAARVTWQP